MRLPCKKWPSGAKRFLRGIETRHPFDICRFRGPSKGCDHDYFREGCSKGEHVCSLACCNNLFTASRSK